MCYLTQREVRRYSIIHYLFGQKAASAHNVVVPTKTFLFLLRMFQYYYYYYSNFMVSGEQDAVLM